MTNWLSRARPDLIREHAPRVLPFGWDLLEESFVDTPEGGRELGGIAYLRQSLSVLFGAEEHRGAGEWLHVSLARPHKLPTWEDVARVKSVFLGDELCVQVLPPRRQYVNVHPYCLHLWRRLDAPTLPGGLVENVYQQETHVAGGRRWRG